MQIRLLILTAIICLYLKGNAATEHQTKYLPTWESLDSRPLPAWYDEAKIGIFVHWGVFSVPSFGSEWFWTNWKNRHSPPLEEFMRRNYKPNATYQEFAKDFTAEFYNPKQWAELFKASGARYVVFTSKHHEGYTMWPSKYSFSWNAVDVGPHRDLLGDLGRAVREAGLTFGLYHSLFEWFNPLYLSDRTSNFTKREFTKFKCLPEMKELISTYQPEILWSDGEWEADDTYWESTDFLAWLYNESPVKDRIVVNDRWGMNSLCRHGDFYTCLDRFNPGILQVHKWENAMTLDRYSWGYRRNAVLADYLSISELLATLAQTISCGGNILINVGPTKEGTIIPIFQERLTDLGKWLSINGDAIYGSKPWTAQNDSYNGNVWYTAKNKVVYAIVLTWPKSEKLVIASVKEFFTINKATITLLGNSGQLKWKESEKLISIKFPDKSTVKSEWAWVLKIR